MRIRGLGPDAAPDFDDGWLRVRPSAYLATGNGKVLQLPVRELALLVELTRHVGEVVAREDLLAAVWMDRGKTTSRVVDAAVTSLRASLSEALPDRVYIHTHHRIGYRFSPESIEPTLSGDGPTD